MLETGLLRKGAEAPRAAIGHMSIPPEPGDGLSMVRRHKNRVVMDFPVRLVDVVFVPILSELCFLSVRGEGTVIRLQVNERLNARLIEEVLQAAGGLPDVIEPVQLIHNAVVIETNIRMDGLPIITAGRNIAV